ncbi:hypothetical protein H0H81_004257 [Sphagnurus paluster]|uniref:Uncharacterized protein n=1 Tax=Sphagnurus paluster TaxID=117069 RepID=A0A9P7FMZ2_9AGAR|nr:hypothetical protein H0H81_004257 [Sphagnurus paluster]
MGTAIEGVGFVGVVIKVPHEAGEGTVLAAVAIPSVGLAIETAIIHASVVTVMRQTCSMGSSACLAAGFGGVGTMKLAGRVAPVAIEVAGAAGKGVIIRTAVLALLDAGGTGRGVAENRGA